MSSATQPAAPDPAAGLWLRLNKDAQNTSRADLPARMPHAPREVWRYGQPAFAPGAVTPMEIARRKCLLVQTGDQMRMLGPDGSSVWPQPVIGPNQVLYVWSTASGPRILARWGQSGVVLLDAATGKTLWRRMFDNGFVGSIAMASPAGLRLFIAPANSTRCLCFQWDGPEASEPRLLWAQDYADRYLPNFGPLLALADMDNDGRDELILVSKPAYVGVIDAETGRIKFDLKHAITGGPSDTGRPYGLVYLADLDGDGFLDLLIAGYRVEEYLAVVRNEAGRGLRQVWSRFVEKDFPEDHRELRPTGTSVADLNGDGKPELVVGLFNMQGDQRWHTLVLDPLVGDTAPLQDWPDRYFWGCYRLADDGRPLVIVSEAGSRKPASPARLEARDGITGRVVAEVANASLLTRMGVSTAPTPHKGAHYAERREPIYLRLPTGQAGLLLEGDRPERPRLWSLCEGRSQLEGVAISPISRVALAAAPDDRGGAIPLDLHLPGLEDAAGPAVQAALVGQAEQRRELVVWQSDGTIVGGVPDLARPGRLRDAWRVPGIQPSLWIGPDGRRVLWAMHPTDEAVLIYRKPGDSPPLRIDLPLPAQRRFGDRGGYRSALVPFTVGSDMRLFVSLVTGRDTVAAALYGANAKPLWLDRDHGTFPHPPAVYDLDGDGAPELLLDDHGRQAIYRLDGTSRLFAQAWHDTVPGRADGAAHALPIVGPFGPGGQTRMIMAPGFSAFEVCDAQGNRLARRAFAGVYDYYLARPAVGRRGDGHWDVGVIHRRGVFEWVDVADLQTRATLDLGEPLLPGTIVVACDLDGDGVDEFIVGTPTGRVLAVGRPVGQADGQERLLWRMDLGAQITDLIAADIDGDGVSELMVTTADGYVRVFRG